MSQIIDTQGKLFTRDPSCSDALPPALAEALADANAVHHTASGEWRGYATLNYRADPQAPLQQHAFPVTKMAPILLAALHDKRENHDIYIAQHSYERYERSTSALLWLNLGQIDLDIYNGAWADFDKDIICKQVLKRLDEWGIPHPTYIIDSGRGLQIKWIWNSPLSPKALPRWLVAHRFLVEEILATFDADIKAILPTQLMRAVGSFNQKNGAPVHFRWINGGDILNLTLVSFDEWATAILPFTREEVQAWRAATAQYRVWDAENNANTQRLLADTPGARRSQQRQDAWKQIAEATKLDISPVTLATVDDLVAGEIWQGRMDFIKRLIALRNPETGVVSEGQRNPFIWIAANGLGWVNREQQKPLLSDLFAWARSYAPSMTEAEVKQSASAVLKRFSQQQGLGSGLYRMDKFKFRELLKITDEERETIRLSRSKSSYAQAEQCNVGVMQFEKMRGLSYDEYKAETRQRRQKSAERTNDIKRKSGQPLREKAFEMHAQGSTQEEIAQAVGKSQQTISRWLKNAD